MSAAQNKTQSIPLIKNAPPSAEHAVQMPSDGTPTGEWETSLFCCLDTNCGALLNCFMGWCLPCVSLAELSQRMGYANYWLVLVVLVGLIAAWYIVFESFDGLKWEDYSSSLQLELVTRLYEFLYEGTKDEPLNVESTMSIYTLIGVLVGYGAWALSAMAASAVMILMTWGLRMRARFHIPGLCVLDLCSAICCPCCAVAQMANHVKIHTKRGCNIGPVDTLPAFP